MEGNIPQQPRSSSTGIFLALLFLVIPIAVAYAAVQRWLPPLASGHGGGIDAMINYQMLTVGSVFVVANLILAYVVWRFSRTARARSGEFPEKVQWRWAIIPVITMSIVAEGGVLVIGMPVWKQVFTSQASAEALTLEITAEQFVWNVRYSGPDGVFGRSDYTQMSQANPLGLSDTDSTAADDVLLINELRLPVNRPVRLFLRSKDVIHSFYLPNFRIKQDCVPGMNIEITFTPTEVGEFELACTELCGLGHYKMRGVVHVMTEDDYNKWLREESTQYRYF